MTSTRTTVPAGPWTVDDLVDPDDGVVTVLELADGAYREVARRADVTVDRPFPVRVRLPR